MAIPETPVPGAVAESIRRGRYGEATEALVGLVAKRPSAPLLVALAAVQLELGDLLAAKEAALGAVAANPQRAEAHNVLARVRSALDERPAALADFRKALDLSFAHADCPPASLPAHFALHNLEQLVYLEGVQGLAPRTLLPVSAAERDATCRQLNQVLDKADAIVPSVKLGGEIGRVLAQPPLLLHDEPPPAVCLNPRNDWGVTQQGFADNGGVACVDGLLTLEALAQLQRFCLRSTVWRRSFRHGYLGAFPEQGFFDALLLQIAAELKDAVPDMLGRHHLAHWWSFVYQHQRPGTDIHADQSDISLNLWITPDAANLRPGSGGLDIWDIPAPADWTFDEYNAGGYAIRAFQKQAGARPVAYAYQENRGLLFKGGLFHQTAASHFAEGFENRRRNITFLFRRTKSR